jgi:DNA-binding beta-propeller fold protein YncE
MGFVSENKIEIMLLRKITLTILLFLLPCISALAQDNQKAGNLSGQYIRWVGEFPPLNAENSDKFGKKVVNFIFGGSDDQALVKPVAACAVDSGNYWVLDQAIGSLYKVEGKVGQMTHFKNKNAPAMTSLVGICTLPDGTILFTDSYLNKIFAFKPGQKEYGVFNDSLALDRPTGIAYSALNQQVWVVETNAHRVSVLDISGHLIRQIGRRGTADGEFNFPAHIWIDDFGKVFIVDAMNFRVQVFSKDGEYISNFGKNGDATGCFARPKGIATDSDGNIYIADALFNTIQIFNADGKFLYNFGSQGHGQGEFWMPGGIFIDRFDYIYIADTYNSRIQVFHYIKGGGP